MAKNIQIFDAWMQGFQDAIARKKGHNVALRVTENSSGQAYAPPTDQENTTGSRRHPISVCVYSKWQSQGRSELGTWRTAANKRGPQTLSIAQSNPQLLLQSETASPPRIERPRVALLMGGDRDCLHSSVCSNERLLPGHLDARPRKGHLVSAVSAAPGFSMPNYNV